MRAAGATAIDRDCGLRTRRWPPAAFARAAQDLRSQLRGDAVCAWEGLTAQQQAFAGAYALTRNACISARAAGYSERSALNSHRLVKHNGVRVVLAAIDQRSGAEPDGTVAVDRKRLEWATKLGKGCLATLDHQLQRFRDGNPDLDRLEAVSGLLKGVFANLSELSDKGAV